MSAAMVQRPFQVVVWGATGFTGKLVCEHLARDYQGKVRWAIAGRDPTKLENVRKELAMAYPECKDVAVLVGDPRDRTSLSKVVSQADVVITLAGPFGLYGKPLVEAAVEAGTHYLDITGESDFVKWSVQQNNKKAEEKGVRIIHCAGFDSVPSDLGTLMVVDHAEKLGKKVEQVINLFGDGRGGFSGGTIASIASIIDRVSFSELQAMASNPYYLAQPLGGSGPSKPSPKTPHWIPAAKSWSAPFVMELVNAQIVNFSTTLRKKGNYSYLEMMKTPNFLVAAIVSFLYCMMGLIFALPPGRWLITRLMPPGSGPSRAMQVAGYWRTEVLAVTAPDEQGKRLVVVGKCGDKRDPGYWSTSRMVLEAALTIALDSAKLKEAADKGEVKPSGVVTPASALGMALLARLRAAGFTFEIEEVREDVVL